jgi:hypothetical protein
MSSTPTTGTSAAVPPSRAASRRRRALAIPAALAAAGIALAGCGGSSPSSPTAGGAAGSSQGASSTRLLKYAECMRSHGVPDFPDPVNGQLTVPPGRDLNPSSPAFQSASQACQSLNPHGSLAPGQSAQVVRSALKFAQCMRSHGMPNFRDPQVSGDKIGMPIPQGIDPNSPQFQAAQHACLSQSGLGGVR